MTTVTTEAGRSAWTPASTAVTSTLSVYLGSIDRDVPPFWAGDLKLVLRADLPRIELRYVPVLEIRADRLVLDGSTIDNHADLEDRLRRRHEAAVRDVELGMSRHNPPDPKLLNLLIDERAPWETVVEFARSVQKVVASCPALIRVFGEVGSSDGGDKSQQLLDGLEPALVE